MTSGSISPGSGNIFRKILSVGFALLGIGLILWLDSWFMDHAGMPDLTGDLNFGLLFLIGFLTSFHCVGMCGPLILGYIAKNAKAGHHSHTAHLLYGVGKTLSYTSIGALFGAFGAIVAFTPFTQGAIGVAAGCFLILFGVHMLEIFPALHHFQFKTPGFVMRFVGKEYRKHSNPFVIGLLNGLMIICGPLQAMYVMAAGSGSWSQGAAILFFFGLGTLPLLMGFGFLTSLLSANLTPKLLKASGVIVMALGLIMLNRGLSVTGSGWDFNTLVARVSLELAPTGSENPSCDNEQTIHMEVLKSRFAPNKFTLRKGVPVKWVIDAKELNECNKEIVVPDYGLDIKLRKGLQVVEFTPKEAGVVPWSCWMGMIPGTFIVVEETPPPTTDSAAPAAAAPEETAVQRLLHQFREQWQKVLD
ncbi:urease accessory protein UreH domain-containing protein [Methylomonas koyamae]|uniref:urease accessory protein UreH domain-containing protein n=1 Tax=Methylomonas koyamae TaxID=702114 RepID=UPI002872CD48|nr:sulfite exporter TauE/SafE family protein [Methylomonas koyamae]WNB75121.1 sulfite exporter TauE/SafE family protein [Methylomonas koyamae]